ncbi:CDP-alcohol phosphatidyltransferase family protein [Soehngenia saccharolytica]|nr:CDP-alcohol phosphatidyltransferase family protein [Soehngenia saccharolytica]
MTLPNIITFFRLLLIPVYLLVYYSNLENRIIIAGAIFFLAGISDVLDGYIARKYNKSSKLGTVLDPFADKLMAFAVLISFYSDGLMPLWILIPIFIKELVMILGGTKLFVKNDSSVIPSNKYGKAATFLLYLSVFLIIIKAPHYIVIFSLILTLVTNILAFYNYLKIYKEVTQ